MYQLIGYVIMNAKGQYYGPGGWQDSEVDARVYESYDALNMLRAFPNDASLIRVRITGYEPERLHAREDFSSSLSVLAGRAA